MAKLKLELEIEIDFQLLGLSCHLPDYRLAHMLNQKLNLDLIRQEDIDLTINKFGSPAYFSNFEYDNEEEYLTINLIANRSDKGYFANELKQLDYFVQLWLPDVEQQNLNWYKHQIKEINQVLTCIELDPNELKSKDHFLF